VTVCQGTVRLRPMELTDLPEVEAIERQSFTNPWPMSAYAHEIRGNGQAQYLVAWLHAPGTPGNGAGRPPRLVGYGGIWMQYDEAHISTVAVDPMCRRRGVGERILVGLIDLAGAGRAVEVTLEVRVSNVAARTLYEKYGFTVRGERRRYYSDNGEDALIMTTPQLVDPDWRARFLALRMALAPEI
jgi:[ribosomal protein S18]-alanine N-acetyltransferase